MIAELLSYFECRPNRRIWLQLIVVVKFLVEQLPVAQPFNKLHVFIFEPEGQSKFWETPCHWILFWARWVIWI